VAPSSGEVRVKLADENERLLRSPEAAIEWIEQETEHWSWLVKQLGGHNNFRALCNEIRQAWANGLGELGANSGAGWRQSAAKPAAVPAPTGEPPQVILAEIGHPLERPVR
jgi:hypothetical protein